MENILKLKEVYIDTSSFESAKKAVEDFGCEWKDWYYERAIMPKSLVGDISSWYPEEMSRIEEVPVSQIIGHDHNRYNFLQYEPYYGSEPRMIHSFLFRFACLFSFQTSD